MKRASAQVIFGPSLRTGRRGNGSPRLSTLFQYVDDGFDRSFNLEDKTDSMVATRLV